MPRFCGKKPVEKLGVSTSSTKGSLRRKLKNSEVNSEVDYLQESAGSKERRERSLNQSANRVSERNPLYKTYDLQPHNVPLNPQNGDNLSSQYLGPSTKQGVKKKEPNQVMEIFRPEVSNHASLNTNNRARSITNNARGRPHAIEPSGSQDYLEHSLHARDPTAKYAHKDSLIVDLPRDRIQKREPSSFFNRVLGGKGKVEDDIDRLSDVPSDVDSVAKDQYILACQMLKGSLLEKEKRLQPLEKEFILSLLGDFEKLDDDNSTTVSGDRLSAIESTTRRLESDPIFRNVSASGSSSLDLPNKDTTRIGRFFNSQKKNQEIYQNEGIGTKNPHTSTRSKSRHKIQLLRNACSPRSIDDLDISSEVGKEAHKIEIIDKHKQIEEDGERVRYNGWNFYKPQEYPYRILGQFDPKLPRVLTPSIMESLRGFFPSVLSGTNFWLKYSVVRDRVSLSALLDSIRTSTYTVIGVETDKGEVFGSFTGSPWRRGAQWFGSGEAFLWKLKKSRFTSVADMKRSNFENEMEIYPCTGYDKMEQFCTSKTIAIGGGDWDNSRCPFPTEPRGIGLMIDGDLLGGETNSCATFANPRLCNATKTSNEFTISNVEVWTLTPCSNINDAAKMEVESIFMGQQEV